MKKYIAECIGTFVLVVFGCGSAVGANSLLSSLGVEIPLAYSTLLIAFAFGLVIVAMAYSIGNVSGCHINPAVSLAMWMSKKIDTKDFICYVVAQCLGAILGGAVLAYLFSPASGLGTNGYGAASALNIDMVQACVVEVILTFVFITAILGVTSKTSNQAVVGIVIGLTLVLVHILGIPFTGTSVNPARSLGPALFVGGDALKQLPVFIIAPLVGSALATLVHEFLNKE